MENLYKELNNRFNQENIQFQSLTSYFSTLSRDEIYLILQYDTNTLKEYVNILNNFQKRKLLIINSFNKIKKLMWLLFSYGNNANTRSLKNLLTTTNIILNENVLIFAIEYLKIEEGSKIKLIENIIKNTNYSLANSDLIIEIIEIVKMFNSKKSLNILEDLYFIPNICYNANFISIIKLLKKKEKSKYIKYIPVILENSYILNNENVLGLINIILNSKTEEQVECLFALLMDVNLFKSRNFYQILNTILQIKDKNKLNSITNIINSHSCNSIRLNRVMNDILSTKYSFHIPAIVCFACNYGDIYSDQRFNIIMETILRTKEKFQANLIPEFLPKLDANVLDYSSSYQFLNHLNKTKNEAQALFILSLLHESICVNHLKQHFLEKSSSYKKTNFYCSVQDILTLSEKIKNEIQAKNLFDVLVKIRGLLDNSNCLNILNLLMSLNTQVQVDAFMKMLSKSKILNSNFTVKILGLLQFADENQIKSLSLIIERNYDFEELYIDNLFKYILETKNPQILALLTAILVMPVYNLKETQNILNFIVDNQDNPDYIKETLSINKRSCVNYIREMEVLFDNTSKKSKSK